MRALLVLVGLLACTDDGRFADLALHDDGPRTLRYALAIPPIPRVDLLIVVDRSPAMRRYRDHVVANLPRMMAALDVAFPSLHLGVISADPGDDGRFATDAAIAGDFLVDLELGDGSRARNYEGELPAIFTRLASFSEGSASSQPLAAMRRALARYPQFRRDGARFVVVFVTATDDASPGAVADYVDFLRAIDPDHETYIGTAAPDPYCDSTPTPRLGALLDAFTNRHTAVPICDDLGAVVLHATPRREVRARCLSERLVDEHPELEGLQPACAGELIYADRPSRFVPSCRTGHAPCWFVLPDPRSCPYDDEGLSLQLERELLDTTPARTFLQLDCLVDR
jgi:hypothetical protein